MDAQIPPPAVSDAQNPYTQVTEDSKSTTPATATLPPPATYSPGSSRPRRRSRNRSRRRCIMSACCYFFLSLILTVGLTIFTEWLIIRPKNGNYDIGDAQLTTFNLTRTSNDNGTSSYNLDTYITFQILFGNPNKKMGFDVKGVNVHVSYAGVEIGYQDADVGPFYQEKRNDRVCRSDVHSENTVLAETIGDGLQREIGLGNVSLLVVMNAKVRNNHNMLKALHLFRKVHLTCLVKLEVPKRAVVGNLVSKSCKVKRDRVF